MKDIKVSVIIPMYNAELTIRNCLDSIVAQSCFRYIYEVIVVDDGSTDNSAEIVRIYGSDHSELNLKLEKQKNSGVSAARNRGLKLSKGNWIALLDADDVWYADKIEYQVNTIFSNPRIDFLGGGWSEAPVNIPFKGNINSLYEASVFDICLKMFPQPSTAIFKRVIYTDIGGFDENQKYAEDGNYFLKICEKYGYYFDPKVVVEYGGGKSGFGETGLSANLKEMFLGNIKNIKELRDRGTISHLNYSFLNLFFLVKYLRRKVIVKLRG